MELEWSHNQSQGNLIYRTAYREDGAHLDIEAEVLRYGTGKEPKLMLHQAIRIPLCPNATEEQRMRNEELMRSKLEKVSMGHFHL